jgi:DNA-binding response OmpR family regulator
MNRYVLLVDDDRDLLANLQAGLGRYERAFEVVLAADGREALDCLQRTSISLVVTDLKMPRLDGFELLAAIMGEYPDIPVIVITAFSTPEMEDLARRGGAVNFIAKPFRIENLARQVMAMLRKQAEGGLLHNISTGIFLQLIEMEQKTCTLRLLDKASAKTGALFFWEGQLMDARAGQLQAEAAAYEIFSWDNVSLAIQNDCVVQEKKVQKELHSLLIEAARRKDENKVQVQTVPAVGEKPYAGPSPAASSADPEDGLMRLRQKIENALGPLCAVEAIREDDSWNAHMESISRAAERLGLGRLLVGYIDRSQAQGHVILPGPPTTVLTVNAKCPRDRLLRLLSE